jgi:hypothetical protein
MVACVTAQGIAAVFPSAPGADVCGQLGLPALPAGANSLPHAFTTTVTPTTVVTANGLPAALRDAIITQMRTTCFSARDALATVTGLFANAKVSWHVSIPTPFPPGRPCASPGFDEADSTVVLTGIPPLPGAGR